ncbi:MAG: hypothetical protein ACRDO8_04140 [Nocardioidaceae bacterium]
MRGSVSSTPELVPVLSRGKHRNPRKGACFMEFASYLAGERWSDKPACTHPLLAGLARLVNDNVDEATRAGMVEMVPEVVGLTCADPRADAMIALRCASAALPVAAERQQRALAVGVLTCKRYLAGRLSEPYGPADAVAARAFASAPAAERWARDFRAGRPVHERVFRRRAAPWVVRLSVASIVGSTGADASRLLRGMLEAAIVDCRSLATAAVAPQESPVSEKSSSVS